MFKNAKPHFRNSSSTELLNEINTTPLVDVMLVLLIIFLITIPVVNVSVDVDLPKENNNQRNVTVKSIVFTVSRSGNITIGKNVFDLNSANFLEGYIKQISTAKPQPEIHIRADKEILFENLGRLLKLLQNSGIERIAFLSEPISESY